MTRFVTPDGVTGAPASLTEEQVYDRAQLLASYSAFDADGILGFLHGVEIGPSPISALKWLPVLLQKLVGVAKNIVEPIVAEVVVVQSCVHDRLEQRVPLVPGEDEDARWVSFARGFVAYGVLDGAWTGDRTKANYLVWAAVLAGRADLLPGRTPRELADEQAKVRRELSDKKAQSIILAYEDLKRPAPAATSGRVGRNDPCPCGSGKKYKKCCLTNASLV